MKNGYRQQVLEDFVRRLREMRAKRAERMHALRGREDALAFQAEVRNSVAASFGPWPERCPLDAAVTGTVQFDGYRIEKVRFFSRPDFMVTGSLYIPDTLSGQAPAVLGTCGHALEGRFCETYQKFALRLVLNGFVVLLYDPIQQGERGQYDGLEYLGMADGLCDAHNVMDKQLELLGQSFASWRVWDGMRALDYLLSRPEVDPARVGITGNSGGGTLTEWIWANDDRLAMAAPSCHVTSFLTNLENELPTDAEQCPPGVIGHGLEMVDMMICQAPKPVLLLGQKYDFFERRGLLEAFRDLRHFYSLLGAEDKTELFIGPRCHGYWDENQVSMLKFFRKHAGIDGEMNARTPVPVPEKESEKLWACPGGSVLKAGAKPIFELIHDMADKAERTRVPPVASEWNDSIAKLLVLPQRPEAAPHFRVLRAVNLDGNIWARYAVETEEGIQTIMRKRLVNRALGGSLDVEDEVTLYAPNLSSELDSLEAPALKELNPGGAVYAVDLRGLGESMTDDLECFQTGRNGYNMDYMMHSFSLMFGESYFGSRVYDLLRTIDLLFAEGAHTIHLVGRAQGALHAAFAAKLHPAVTDVTLHNAPSSFREWIDAKVCDWPVANVPRGVLNLFDLPDLYASLGEKLTIISRWNAYQK